MKVHQFSSHSSARSLGFGPWELGSSSSGQRRATGGSGPGARRCPGGLLLAVSKPTVETSPGLFRRDELRRVAKSLSCRERERVRTEWSRRRRRHPTGGLPAKLASWFLESCPLSHTLHQCTHPPRPPAEVRVGTVEALFAVFPIPFSFPTGDPTPVRPSIQTRDFLLSPPHPEGGETSLLNFHVMSPTRGSGPRNVAVLPR